VPRVLRLRLAVPELPEVEVVRLGLAPAVTGARVDAVSVVDPRGVTRHVGGPADFESRLAGVTLGAPVRRGKFLWVPVEGRGEALLAHLGMSGQVLLRDESMAPERHVRVQLWVDGPGGRVRVDFVDQRTFGSLAVEPLSADPLGARAGVGWPEVWPEIPVSVAHIALDPLDPRFDDAGFCGRLRAKRTELKRALLDQTLVSGIGNIYADEALWSARVHPRTVAATLSAQAARRILDEVRAVMLRALAEGGTSFDAQYVNVNGQAGYFSRSLNAYGRTGEPCHRCGRAIVREAFMNRSSHYCPRCQRLR